MKLFFLYLCVTGMTINYPAVRLYRSILYMYKLWGLNESVKKGGLLLILLNESVKKVGLRLILLNESVKKGQVWTCMGALGLAINMRASYTHWHIILTTSRLWSCGTRLLLQACQYQVRLEATTMVWNINPNSSPSRSLRSEVVGWTVTLLSLSPIYFLIIYFLISCLH